MKVSVYFAELPTCPYKAMEPRLFISWETVEPSGASL